VLLNLTPSDLLIMVQNRMSLYRVQIIKRPAVSEAEAGLLSVWKDVNDPNLYMRSDHIISVNYYSRNLIIIIE
jgi:hypothetical protein